MLSCSVVRVKAHCQFMEYIYNYNIIIYEWVLHLAGSGAVCNVCGLLIINVLDRLKICKGVCFSDQITVFHLTHSSGHLNRLSQIWPTITYTKPSRIILVVKLQSLRSFKQLLGHCKDRFNVRLDCTISDDRRTITQRSHNYFRIETDWHFLNDSHRLFFFLVFCVAIIGSPNLVSEITPYGYEYNYQRTKSIQILEWSKLDNKVFWSQTGIQIDPNIKEIEIIT